MRVDIRAPVAGQRFQRAHVIEMTMSEQNIPRLRIRSEAPLGFANNGLGRAAQAGVDERPFIAARLADEVDIHEQLAQPGDVRRHFVERADARAEFEMRGTMQGIRCGGSAMHSFLQFIACAAENERVRFTSRFQPCASWVRFCSAAQKFLRLAPCELNGRCFSMFYFDDHSRLNPRDRRKQVIQDLLRADPKLASTRCHF